jgi:hypothetical protein
MQLPTEHTVRGDLPHPCSEESDVRLIILAVVESRANRKKPESLLVCRPTDRNSGKAAERLDERIALLATVEIRAARSLRQKQTCKQRSGLDEGIDSDELSVKKASGSETSVIDFLMREIEQPQK